MDERKDEKISFPLFFFYQYKWDQSLHCVLVHTNDKISLSLPAIMYEQNCFKPVPSLAMSK